MASAEQRKAASRSLTQWIDNESRIVTYRELSREVGCHVNVAKNLLLDHYTSNPSLYPTYLLTGPLRADSTITQTQLPSLTPANLTSTQRVKIVDMDQMSEGEMNSEDEDEDDGVGPEQMGNDEGAESGLAGELNVGAVGGRNTEVVKKEQVERWGVVLVGAEALEDKKKLFEADSLSVHIHSLAPAPVTDPAQYLISSLTLREHPAYHDSEKYGTISGEAFKPSVKATADKKAMKDGAMDWSKKTVVGKKDAAEKVAPSAKLEPKKSIFATAPPAKAAPAPAPPAKSASPAPPAGPSKKASAGVTKKKRVIASDTEEDEEEPAPPASASKSKSLTEPTSSMVREDDRKAMEAMMSMDMDVDMGESSDREEAPKGSGKKGAKTADEVKVKHEPGTGTRKRRKVKKTVTETNAKGYMVSKDVWTEESCSESEEDSQSQPKKSTTAKPPIRARDSTSSIGSNNEKKTPASSASAGGGRKPAPTAKGQSTLKGFFTKK
ncbi:hypothetical protein IAU60_002581 [Kwoniella sp. DSM 27419]